MERFSLIDNILDKEPDIENIKNHTRNTFSNLQKKPTVSTLVTTDNFVFHAPADYDCAIFFRLEH